MSYFYCVLISLGLGYFICCINPAYIFSRIKGSDIRKKGSGNAGASNAMLVFGKAIGIFCAIFDIAKAVIATLLAVKLCSLVEPKFDYAFMIAAAASVLGHMFPFYMKFRGGKGLAVLGGVVLAYNWKFFLIFLGIEVLIALATNYICFVPLTASIAFPILYGFFESDFVGPLIFAIASVAIILKHIENLKRIYHGTEVHFSFLWDRKKEEERMDEKGLHL
jgi:glycerol-3-phosphate acyltransferase PlsY